MNSHSIRRPARLTRSREFAIPEAAGVKSAAFIGDVALSPDAHLLYAADLYSDSIAVINLQIGPADRALENRSPTLPHSGRSRRTPTFRQQLGRRFGHATGRQYRRSYLHNARGPHATDLLLLSQAPPTEAGRSDDVARLFVAASNTNNVYSFGVIRDGTLNPLETINLSLTPLHPLGMTPSALAVSSQGQRLFVDLF